MERLPEEILLHILFYLEPGEVVAVQGTSRYFLCLGRDDTLWKALCFQHSRTEIKRRRQHLLSTQEPSLVALRRAMNASNIPSFADVDVVFRNNHAESSIAVAGASERANVRAMASWDPSYPSEKPDFYNEFVQRHAPITLSWLQSVTDDAGEVARESIGMAVVEAGGDGIAGKVVAPLDDGSVCIWDISRDRQAHRRGRIVARSASGLVSMIAPSGHGLHRSAAITNETGAVENICVDKSLRRAYVAVHSELHEIDLNTLQVISQRTLPFPITALSSASHPIPLTIGTNNTLHLHDTRSFRNRSSLSNSTRCELIGGTSENQAYFAPSTLATRVYLSQPGPLSILHPPSADSPTTIADSIWVAGRFTSLLTYDRRFWPRISATLFSGARISSLAFLPYPYIDRSWRQDPSSSSLLDLNAARAAPGSTLIAAGQYKGKGSLELYAISRDATAPANAGARGYCNRQTTSKSRLLSVTPHGTRLVFSDGDGNLKWVERDGSTLVRNFNINDISLPVHRARPQASRPSTMFSSAESEEGAGDIVQKIVATGAGSTHDSGPTSSELLIWTGEGRLGLVGFGNEKRHSGGREDDEALGATVTAEAEEEERYVRVMREALERQAHETRFVRNLGLRF